MSVNWAIIGCGMFGAMSSSELMRTFCQLDHQEQTSVKFESKIQEFSLKKMDFKISSQNTD